MTSLGSLLGKWISGLDGSMYNWASTKSGAAVLMLRAKPRNNIKRGQSLMRYPEQPLRNSSFNFHPLS